MLGMLAEPENATDSEAEAQAERGIPYRSSAVTVSFNQLPAVCVPGFVSGKWSSAAAFSVKLPDEPVLPAGESTEVTVRVVLAALKRVTEAVATPDRSKERRVGKEPKSPAAA